jgi:hypothetical protein
MFALAALLLAGACALPARAQRPDRLDSPGCKLAREELEAVLDEASAGRSAPRRLAQARRQAADACLGPANALPERSGAPYPALAMPVPAQKAPLPPAAAAPPAGPLIIPRPASMTACDPAGCWDSEGRRLNQQGPMLIGPRGPCSVQAGAVSCP